MSQSAGHFVETLAALVSRELRMRYKGSFFGILWTVISPLGTVVILQLLFTRILRVGIPHFAVFMYSALLPFAWFQLPSGRRDDAGREQRPGDGRRSFQNRCCRAW